MDIKLLVEARSSLATGEAVKIRENAHLSQGELARACRVSAASISRWEGGIRVPSGKEAERYARMLRLLKVMVEG